LTKDLLDILTLNGATAAQVAQDVGRLKAGMRADLVAVNLKRAFWPGPQPGEDPIEALLNRAEGRDVVLTMVNGHILYKDGALTKLDRDRLAELGLALLRDVRNVPEKDRQHLTALLLEHMTDFYDNSTAGPILPAKSLTRGLGPS
jgi:5-methylthioadenosine/S-adenosylhomocysteine deaminase